MAVPTPLHYWLVRLRALNRPRLWGTGLGLLLLGLASHQYLRNPEWLRDFSLDDSNPTRLRAEENLADLSPSELADLAEIDDLGLLLNQLQPLTADTLTEVPADPSPETAAALALPRPTAPGQTEEASPFAAYLERTRFRGGAATEGALPAEPTLLTPSSSSGRGGEVAPMAPSPLESFLNPSPEASAPPGTPAVAPGQATSPTLASPGDGPQAERLTPTQPTGLTPPPWVVEGQIPGVDQRFIRTTPEMSPPPGTTGYHPPPSMAPAPSGLPSTAPPPGLSPAPPPLNPTLPGMGTNPGTGAGGNTLPPPGPAPYNAPPSRSEMAPFSAPRPPGSNIGGGYINTFSDPSGPGD